MNLNSVSARLDRSHPLSEDELRRLAPSVFATAAHHRTSDRFAPISTIKVLEGLVEAGFHPFGVKQTRCLDSDRREFTKHLIRLRRLDATSDYTVNGTVFEVLLRNANDGSAAYERMAGLFRIKCLNGLVAATVTENIKVRHTGNAVSKVIEGSYRVLGEAQQALAAPSEWSKQQLAPAERQAFAEAAHVLPFGDADGDVKTPIRAEQLLEPRRADDKARDLWTTLNVIQENVIRGGLHAVGRDASNRQRRVTMRPVRGIDQDVRLNKSLWVLAERMAQIKTAA